MSLQIFLPSSKGHLIIECLQPYNFIVLVEIFFFNCSSTVVSIFTLPLPPPCPQRGWGRGIMGKNRGRATKELFFFNSHHNGYKVVSHCGFDLHLPNNNSGAVSNMYVFLHHQAVLLRHLLGGLQLSSHTRYLEIASDPTVLGAQSTRLPPSHAHCKSRFVSLSLDSPESGDSCDLLPVRLMCQTGSQNPKEHFTYLTTGLSQKVITPGQPDGRGVQGKVSRKGCRTHDLFGCATPQSPGVLHVFNLEALNPFLLHFYGGFILQTRLIKSLTIGDYTFSPGGGTEFSNPLIMWLVPLITGPHP